MAENSVSYSQFSMYMQCPKKWEQEYVKNKRVFEQSIHTIFGTAMHETLQNYLTVMYSHSVKKADQINLGQYLQDRMAFLYKEAADKTGHFSTPKELHEFYLDGIASLDYFVKNRSLYFPSKQHELLGIETELKVPLLNNIVFKGYIDVVIRDNRSGRIRVIDLKTSTRGWNKWQKKDKTKTSQLILYKEFYAKQFEIDVEMISVEYIILRRKINEDSDWPMKRIQFFEPPSGKPTRNRVAATFGAFLSESFTEEGKYIEDREFKAITTSACKYCKYRTDEEICPKKLRIKIPKDAD